VGSAVGKLVLTVILTRAFFIFGSGSAPSSINYNKIYINIAGGYTDVYVNFH
jgi:hypothetical protein